MGAKAARKPAKKLVDAARAGLAADSDLSRLWNVHAALVAAPEEHRVALAEQVVGEAPAGLARDWLATIATEDRAAARGFAGRAATVTSGRSFVTDLLTDVASYVDDADLYDALENLIAVRPFAPLFLERGSAIARTRGARELAAAIDERHRFVAIYAEILNDLRTDAAERLQKIALVALDRLEPDERTCAVLWILTEPNVIPVARRWARIAGFTDPAIDVVTLAWAINESTGIHDEEEAELGKRAAAGGPAALERASEVLGVAVERGLATAIEHLAPSVPAAFATSRGFAHVLAGLGRGGAVGTRICEEVRAFAPGLDDAQAARLVEALLAVESPGATVTAAIDPHALGRAFFYLQHPGAVAALAAALQRPLSDTALDHVHDCLAHIDTEPAQLLLLERIYVEHRLVRDLVFSLTRGAIQARHRELLAMLEQRPSVHAAWIALGAQVNWLHRPKATLEIVERVLSWSGAPDADPSKLAYIHGHGVLAALELHRYPLGKRALAALDALPDPVAADPTDPRREPVLDEDSRALADGLASGRLDAELASLRAQSAAARSGRQPIIAVDDLLGRLGGCKVATRLHTDATTGEVWFLDAEGEPNYYDGYDVTPPPFEWLQPTAEGPTGERCEALARFATGWHVDARTFCEGDGGLREVVRSGQRLLMRIDKDDHTLTRRTFAFGFPTVERAAAVFAAMERSPIDGTRKADPFYVSGKKGGAVIREIEGTPGVCFWRLGRELHVGTKRFDATAQIHDTEDEAMRSFDALDAELTERGELRWKIALDASKRPLTELPLLHWMEERARDEDRDAVWHLEALPEIRAALGLAELSLDTVEVTLGPPASEAELATYEATLPTPLPAPLRAMWQAHATASWRVGDDSQRLRSPGEVLGDRAVSRARLQALVVAYAKQPWPVEYLDVIVVDQDGNATLVFDTRQHTDDCYAETSSEAMRSPQWYESLAWMLAIGPLRDFISSLRRQFPELRKLKYGERLSSLVRTKREPRR
ncbi:MAG: hypothetical protein WKG01_30995 [Kofleriaceae bacterium]